MSTNVTETIKQAQQSGRIQTLPMELANQIAAGEVVERPASVLKELLENSLDAGSTDIYITIEQGGVGLIRVQDNGVGICHEDLELALSSHATSKIASFSDLESIHSFGFRGEALASIGSVSKLRLTSSTKDQELGYVIEKQGRDRAYQLLATAKSVGTRVEVKDLFYNTPARRKFLRSEKSEMAYIEEVYKQIALSQPAVSFTWDLPPKTKKRLPVCKSIEAYTRRVAELCGHVFVEHANYIESEINGLSLKGWLGHETQCRSKPDLQYFYINNRIIRDKIINHAVRQAFQTICTRDRYPCYILFLECDPASIDVNVHPTKHEVRFREARTVHAFISYTIQQALNRDVAVQFSSPSPSSNRELNLSVSDSETSLNTTHLNSTQGSFGNPLSMLSNEFLLLENEQGWVVLDVKAFQKNEIIQQFKNKLEQNTLAAKPLLIPISISICSDHIQDETSEILINLGFNWTPISPTALLLRTIPNVFDKVPNQLEALFQKISQLKEIEKIMVYIAEHDAQYESVLLDELRTRLQNPTQIEQIKKSNPPIFRQITVDILRSMLK